MKIIKIDLNNSGKTIYKFISENYPKINDRNIKRYILLQKILINSKPISTESIVYENDSISFDIPESFFIPEIDKDFLKSTDDISIIYEDKNIILLNKPKGILCQKDKNEKIKTLENMMRKYLFNKKDFLLNEHTFFIPTLCNRLDFNTDGIVIGAKNIESLRIINKKIYEKEIIKFYLCKIVNKPPKNSELLVNYLQKNYKTNTVKIYNNKIPNSVEVKLEYKLLKKENNLYTLEINLITGKSHQIRAQLENIGCPIFGDKKYNQNKRNKGDGQELKSYKIIFAFKTDSGILNYLKNKEFKI